MATLNYELRDPTKQSGQYQTLAIVSKDGLSSLYVTAGHNLKGVPRAFELVSAHLEITTDATVADRTPYLVLLNDMRLSQGGVKGKSIAASSAGSWDVFRSVSLDSNSSGANSLGICGVDGMIIQGDGRLNCFWINGKAGDVVNYYFLFKWLKPEL